MTGSRRTLGSRLKAAYAAIFFGGTWTPIVALLFLCHLLMFAILSHRPEWNEGLLTLLGLGYGEPAMFWQAATMQLVADPAHPALFALSMLVFLMVAGDVSVVMGWRRFLGFYLLSGAIAGLGCVLWTELTGVQVKVAGATGAQVALLFAFGKFFRTRRVHGWIPAPLYCAVIGAMYGAGLCVLAVPHGAGAVGSQVSQFLAAIGAAMYLYIEPRYRYWRLLRQTFREVEAIQEAAILEENIDEILAKVSEVGPGSLSSSERRALKRASRVMNRRRRERS